MNDALVFVRRLEQRRQEDDGGRGELLSELLGERRDGGEGGKGDVAPRVHDHLPRCKDRVGEGRGVGWREGRVHS